MNKKKIIVVEDDEYVLEFITYALKGSDFEIISLENGIQALDLISKGAPDLIVFDYMTPKMSGLQFCAELAKDPKTKQIPKIMMTASEKMEMEKIPQEYGVSVLLKKPFTSEELIEKIDALLRGN